MKRTITLLAFAFGVFTAKAQSFIADFEGFSLGANSAYSSTTSVPFQTTNAIFPYNWDTGFSFWSSGFAYTNKYDSATAGAGNLYGVKTLKGYNSSNTYVVVQPRAVMKLKGPYDTFDGFYITNTTYAYKSMKLGDNFAKKFGGVSGNDPDFFKVTVKGYFQGIMKPDSTVFFLANYTYTNNALDYIVNTWQYVNTTILGQVDSVRFFMYSTDYSGNFMNTPAFFAIDNVSASDNFVGLTENSLLSKLTIYPNPTNNKLNIDLTGTQTEKLEIKITDITGKIIFDETLSGLHNQINLEYLQKGIYLAEITIGENKITKKLIKE